MTARHGRSGTQVRLATPDDVPAWLGLAAEVEPDFGPLVHDAGFLAALHRNIGRGTALCVPAWPEHGPPGTLAGGLLFSGTWPRQEIAWLVVAGHSRRLGVGRELVHGALHRFTRPGGIVEVLTFPFDHHDPAPHALYRAMGFIPDGAVVRLADGSRRVRYILHR